MKPYQDLTFLGKLRRLRGLACAALERYPIEIVDVRVLSFSTNLLYRVDTSNGERFVLRLASPGWRTLENLHAEAYWMEALARDTQLRLPEVVRTRSGEAVLSTSVEGVTGVRYLTLMRWLPGHLLGTALTEANLEKMGKLFAALHAHAASWQPPVDFNPQRFEHVLSRGEPLALFAPEQIEAFPPGARDRLWALYERIEAEYVALDRADLRVIHCDLWHDNIKMYHGQLSPFDFEDTIWGFRLHDIAMAMLDLLETVGLERYEVLLPAFRRGYTAHLPWPDGDLVLLQLGRMLWILNWMARFRRKDLPAQVASYTGNYDHYQRTGVLLPPVSP
jgi:Ser/Thr protein kinase RdoA (MazF antagonist)